MPAPQRQPGVVDGHERAALGRLEQDLEPRILAAGRKVRGVPALDDAPVGLKLERRAADAAAPRAVSAAHPRFHGGSAAGVGEG